ncbi:DUF1178 family protein [Sinirhodobacter huangdaonensis]|jgi:hypothetical protein|uniref:DUF1178 family protein n=1 Tax=Paenirhodobacter huangdaonensis TaxID=2501515 RepID=A0A443LR59_9RHOB|nr:DUF1178 family protein [Sinirhodobacter huangdaonensis]RWR51671.1 DUF1178 family protein [Sinirhodobacter huangdaonensis]
MIRYTLKCDQDHSFDSWFASAEAFEKLRAAGMVACSVCGSTVVEKALMTPALRPARDTAAETAPATAAHPLSTPQGALEAALAEMRRVIEENSDDVGRDFVDEARAMHSGEKPERAIRGEARPDEARALLEEGIAVTPLPFLPPRKTN